jgi:hypothetical protein
MPLEFWFTGRNANAETMSSALNGVFCNCVVWCGAVLVFVVEREGERRVEGNRIVVLGWVGIKF